MTGYGVELVANLLIGDNEGVSLGILESTTEGVDDAVADGLLLALTLGLEEATKLGVDDAVADGLLVALTLGSFETVILGTLESTTEGVDDAVADGLLLALTLGSFESVILGTLESITDGTEEVSAFGSIIGKLRKVKLWHSLSLKRCVGISVLNCLPRRLIWMVFGWQGFISFSLVSG